MKDYYDILGIDKGASADEIKRAFKKLAREHHPALNKDDAAAEKRFKEINEAYAVLSDPEKKRQFDTFGAEGFGQRFSQEDIFRGSDVFSVLNDLFGGGGGRRGGGGFESIFGDMFGGGGQRRSGFNSSRSSPFGAQGSPFGGFGQAGPQKGQDYESEMVISLDEAFRGTRRRLTLQTPDGRTVSLDVTVPEGVKDGQKLRLSGKGGPGAGGPAGDLMLKLSIAPHPHFKLEGSDLTAELAVPVTTLALGGAIEVPTIDGPLRQLKVKAGTAPGVNIRIKGAGMGKPDGPRGDLYVKLIATLPTEYTDEQIKLLEQLRESGF